MKTSDFDYNLPPELIAQRPVEPRDSSRLMVVDKQTETIQHRHFFDIADYLAEGDLLVWNNSKVFKARLRGEVMLNDDVVSVTPLFKEGRGEVKSVTDKLTPPRPPLKRGGVVAPTGKILNASTVEIFLVRPMENKFVWKVLAKPGKKLRLGMKVKFAEDFVAEVMLKEADGTVLMQFAEDDLSVRAKANRYGEVPTPPYIKSSVLNLQSSAVDEVLKIKDQRLKIDDSYQTIYARHEGSVAAPTAGFHFTPELIEKLEKKGVQFAEVTLHVGLGTFLPVKTDKIEEHKMHSEQVELTAKNADLISAAKAEGRRVIAVGTTTVRALEAIAQLCHSEHSEESLSPKTKGDPSVATLAQDDNVLRAYSGDVNIFITPGFKFQIVDALVTNFHLPKSTLLMLVSSFMGDTKFILECYQKAIEENYRFYSFGDAMLIK